MHVTIVGLQEHHVQLGYYIYIYNKYIHVNMIQLVVEFLIGYLFAGFLFTGHGELKLTITRIYPQSLTGLKL